MRHNNNFNYNVPTYDMKTQLRVDRFLLLERPGADDTMGLIIHLNGADLPCNDELY